MPLSTSAIAWAVTGTLGIGTCAVGLAALNSGAPANADPRPAITVAGLPQATASPKPTVSGPTGSPTLTAATAPTARSSVSARSKATPVTRPSPVTPPSPKSAASPRSAASGGSADSADSGD